MDFNKIVQDNQSRVQEIIAYKNKPISKYAQPVAFVGGSLVLVAVTGLFLLQVIQGALALGVTAVTVAGLFYFVKIIKEANPLIQQKIKNKRIELMMREAREHGIEQLQNKILEDTTSLKQKKESRDKLGASLEVLRTQVDRTKEGSDLRANMQKQLEKLEPAYEQMKKIIKNQEKQLELYEEKVKEAKQLDEFNKVASEFMDTFESTADTKLEEMLSLESFAAIETEFSKNSIAIENLIADMEVK